MCFICVAEISAQSAALHREFHLVLVHWCRKLTAFSSSVFSSLIFQSSHPHVYPTHAFNRHIPLFRPLTVSHSFAPDLPRCLTASLHPSPVILSPLALLTSSPSCPLFIIPYNSYIHSHLVFNPSFGSVRPSHRQSASPFFSSTEPWEGNGASLCSPVRTLRGGFSAAPGADRPDHEEQPAGDASGPGSAVWTAAGQWERFTSFYGESHKLEVYFNIIKAAKVQGCFLFEFLSV